MSTPSARAAVLADSVAGCKVLVGRYLPGFNDVTCVRGVPDLPNHVAWCLGHCAQTMHFVADLISGATSPGLPASDFVAKPVADGTKGSRDKGVYDAESVAFGSTVEERHDKYPKLDRCVEIFNAACDRLEAVVRALPDAALDKPHPWGAGGLFPASALVMRMVFHNGFHTGQIADLRRALGFKRLFG